jgi:hypothetical protein
MIKQEDQFKLAALLVSGLLLAGLIYTLYQGMVVQPQRALDLEQAKLDSQEQERQDKIDYSNKKQWALDLCLAEADDDYWNWIEINMEEKDDGTYWGLNSDWDKAEANKKVDEDACYRQHSLN